MNVGRLLGVIVVYILIITYVFTAQILYSNRHLLNTEHNYPANRITCTSSTEKRGNDDEETKINVESFIFDDTFAEDTASEPESYTETEIIGTPSSIYSSSGEDTGNYKNYLNNGMNLQYSLMKNDIGLGPIGRQ